jgi:type II secretory ATPase GspE/PulE/Tfp pilus assembly ATPase PilB-like protein
MGLKSIPPGSTIFKATGCPSCSQSGYSGRTVIHELMMVDEEIRKHIIRNGDGDSVKKASIQAGMRTLREDGVLKVLKGITTIDELARVTHAEA